MERHQGVWVPEGVRVITHNFCHDLDKDLENYLNLDNNLENDHINDNDLEQKWL